MGPDAKGGDARATIEGEAIGIGSPSASHRLTAVAYGGRPGNAVGARGGDATAIATGSTGHGNLVVSAEATGGSAHRLLLSESAGMSGNAIAIATGSHSGEGSLRVVAEASAGESAAASGIGEVSASGVASSGADVTVEARLVGGRDAELRDAVSGSTSGLLTLVQEVVAVLSGESERGNGDVRNSLVAANQGGGDLAIEVGAYSAPGSNPLFPIALPEPGDVILGDIIGCSESGAAVAIDVRAVGNEVRLEAREDPSRTSQILGVSNGGNVEVRAHFFANTNLRTTQTASGIVGDVGRSVVMDNIVDGSTSGALWLRQDASAGSAAPVRVIPGSNDTIERVGDGGEARSRLSKTGSFSSLRLEGYSRAGRGGEVSGGVTAPVAGVGGDAHLLLEGINQAGSVTLVGGSYAGIGGASNAVAGDGGNAFRDLRGTTLGDGQSIQIGPGNDFDARGGAGGDARYSPFSGRTSAPVAGDGGDGVSRSEGHAQGDSLVDVRDSAVGGSGGRGLPRSLTPDTGSGGNGGRATSTAIAAGAGPSLVRARSHASGGAGGRDLVDAGGAGGDADATARATGLGEVEAMASAFGGRPSLAFALGGSAHARAEATGTSGTAHAAASMLDGSSRNFRAAITRNVHQTTTLDVYASNRFADPAVDEHVDGSAFLTGRPTLDSIERARQASGGLDALLRDRPGALVESLGQWRARGTHLEVSSQITELDITLESPDTNGNLMLAVFELDVVGGGFEELSFRLEVFGDAFGETQTFTEIESARSFFASPLDLGAAYQDSYFSDGYTTPAVRAIFEVTVGLHQSIGFGVAAVVVPEPASALLLGLGLTGLALGRPRH